MNDRDDIHNRAVIKELVALLILVLIVISLLFAVSRTIYPETPQMCIAPPRVSNE